MQIILVILLPYIYTVRRVNPKKKFSPGLNLTEDVVVSAQRFASVIKQC